MKKEKQQDNSQDEKAEVETDSASQIDESEAKYQAEKAEIDFSERPSMIAEAKWYNKIWFSWVFPIIEKAGK